MERTLPIPSSEDPTPEREAVIDQLIARNHNAFSNWLLTPGTDRQLDFSHDALQALIPRRIYELANDPVQVEAIPRISTNAHIAHALIVEHRTSAISNPEGISQWVTAITSKRDSERELAERLGKNYYFYYPLPPGEIDEFHSQYPQLLENGSLTANDYWMLEVSLDGSQLPEVLLVSMYEDREELQGKKVASSFYKGLRSLARAMGYRFIAGLNDKYNIDFFTRNFHRSRLGQIKPEYRDSVYAVPDEERLPEYLEYYTIDFLYPEDKDLYVDKNL